jgi:N-6 DNA Methylase
MTDVRPILDRVWDSLRKASIVDNLAIVEYIAALLIEIGGKPWPFDPDQKPGKPRVRYNPDDIDLKNQLELAAGQMNNTDRAQALAELFNRQILFYSSKYKGNGAYPTPRHIVDFMMNLLQVKPEHDFADLICGSGGFLVYRYQQEQVSKKRRAKQLWGSTVGVDIAPEWTRLAHANLLLHGISADKKVQIYTGDVLRLCGQGGELEDMRFDRIALSPPLDIPMQIPTLEDELDEGSFFRTGMPYSDADVLSSDTLLAHLMYTRLKEGGKGVTIVSARTLTVYSPKEDSTGTDVVSARTPFIGYSREAQALRKILVQGKEIQAVIELKHNALYPFTNEQACLLMIHERVQQSPWLLRIERDGYDAALYHDLLQEPRFAPEWNDMPFIRQVVNLAEDVPGESVGGITYRFMHFDKRIAGVIIKTKENASITRILYQQLTSVSQLLVETLHNNIPVVIPWNLSVQPANKLDIRPIPIFRDGMPGQWIAVSCDGRILGVTVSVEELLQHKCDLLPGNYIRRHIPDADTFEYTPTTADAPASSPVAKGPSQEAAGASAEVTSNPVVVPQLPPIADLPNIEPILGAKQQAIWNEIKEQYTLYFTARELTGRFSGQEISATLRLLERFGLIVYVQVDGEDGLPAYYYRRVTSAELVSSSPLSKPK